MNIIQMSLFLRWLYMSEQVWRIWYLSLLHSSTDPTVSTQTSNSTSWRNSSKRSFDIFLFSSALRCTSRICSPEQSELGLRLHLIWKIWPSFNQTWYEWLLDKYFHICTNWETWQAPTHSLFSAYIKMKTNDF